MKQLRLSTIIFLLFIVSSQLEGATCTSQGDGDWDNAATWSCGRVPNSTDDVVIQPTHEINLDTDAGSAVTVASLTLENSGSNGGDLAIDGVDLTVTNDVDIDKKAGINITNDGSLTIGGDLYYADNGTVEVVGNGSVLISGCVYKSAGGGGADIDKVLSPSLTYCVEGNGGCASGGVTGESTNGCTVLPITLVYFRAEMIDDAVSLNWLTASEENNAYFSIEKSFDGDNFKVVKEIDGAGTTLEAIQYNYIDNSELAAITYYRLKQTDFDGKSSYSKVAQVYLDPSTASGNIQLYPNPSKGEFKVDGFNVERLELEVYDTSGKSVKLSGSATHFSWGVEGVYQLNGSVASGLYFVFVKTDKGVFKEKLLIE